MFSTIILQYLKHGWLSTDHWQISGQNSCIFFNLNLSPPFILPIRNNTQLVSSWIRIRFSTSIEIPRLTSQTARCSPFRLYCTRCHLREPIKGDVVKRQPGQRRSSRWFGGGRCVNYEGCARPFPAPETKYDAVNSSFTTLDTTDSRPSPWNITSSSTIGANRIGNE